MIENNKNDKSISAVDEFNRNKRIYKKLKFKSKDVEYIWKCFLVVFKKTFRIQREIELGLKFTLKVGGILSNYEIEMYEPQKHQMQIKWFNGNDKYWLKFYLRKKYIGKGSIIRTTEHIYRNTPFWGLQDTAGLMWLKKNFKIEMLRIKQGIELVINNNGQIPYELNNHLISKTFKANIKFKENNIDYLIEILKKYFKTTKDIKNNKIFTSKINKSSIIYNIDIFDLEKQNITISWKQGIDKYKLEFNKTNNGFNILQTVALLEDIKIKTKLKLIKTNFKEFINDIKKIEKASN